MTPEGPIANQVTLNPMESRRENRAQENSSIELHRAIDCMRIGYHHSTQAKNISDPTKNQTWMAYSGMQEVVANMHDTENLALRSLFPVASRLESGSTTLCEILLKAHFTQSLNVSLGSLHGSVIAAALKDEERLSTMDR